MFNNLYVDNIITGCNSEENLLEYYKTARSIMMDAKFNLRSWASNSPLLTDQATKDNVGVDTTNVNILGIQWNTTSDTLSLAPRIPIPTHSSLVTKREVLRESAKIFDPLGLITPITIKAKIFIQQLWQQNIDWDEPLCQQDCELWLTIAKDIQTATSMQIPRRYFYSEDNPTSPFQLHVFADASMKAYGAVAFICTQSRTSFTMAKNRVAPLKQLTLPKLELMAALTAARLSKFITESINSLQLAVHLWTDSQIVLYWIQNRPKSNQFVSHRVAEIIQLTTTATWRYCPTADNPADLLTRGVSFEQLQSSLLWKQGPEWLPTESDWPNWQPSSQIKLQAALVTTSDFLPLKKSTPSYGIHHIISVSDHHNLNKLVAVTAYVLRFVYNVKNIQEKCIGPLTAIELHQAKMRWVKYCQHEAYLEELTTLQSNTTTAKRLPLVRQLRLFLDDEGFIRCGGRIHNAPLSKATKFPYLLPPRHPLTSLIIMNAHVTLFHAGTNSTLTLIRQMFWIPTARQRIKSALRTCVTCRKHSGKPYSCPDPPPLPAMRTREAAPFTITGIDFTGALYVRDSSGESKAYICLFTCANTRAIHLEIVTDLSAETFLLAFRRFTSRKSLPQIVVSDNGSTYLSAAEKLKQLFQSQHLLESLNRRGVLWKFIPKRAPWYGGWWERLIGLTKMSLKKVLGRTHVTLQMLETLVTEVEAILNDRPITYVPSEEGEVEPLTPAHLLYGRRITSLPHQHVDDDEVDDPTFGDNPSIQRRARQLDIILKHFQGRWKREYLTSLREYHRASGNNRQTIKIGDIVLVHDDTNRINWRLAVVEELLTGKDGITRAANIRTSQGRTSRPIVKLYPLEVSSTEPQQDKPLRTNTAAQAEEPQINDDRLNVQLHSNDPTKASRPQRRSKEKARERMIRWLGDGGCPEDVMD